MCAVCLCQCQLRPTTCGTASCPLPHWLPAAVDQHPCLPACRWVQVSGKTVGVVGTGRIGAEFCTLLKVGVKPAIGQAGFKLLLGRQAEAASYATCSCHSPLTLAMHSAPLMNQTLCSILLPSLHSNTRCLPWLPSQQGFGCKLLAYDMYESEELKAQGITYTSMEELLAQVGADLGRQLGGDAVPLADRQGAVGCVLCCPGAGCWAGWMLAGRLCVLIEKLPHGFCPEFSRACRATLCRCTARSWPPRSTSSTPEGGQLACVCSIGSPWAGRLLPCSSTWHSFTCLCAASHHNRVPSALFSGSPFPPLPGWR